MKAITEMQSAAIVPPDIAALLSSAIEPRRDGAKLKLSEKRAEIDHPHVLVTACDGKKPSVSVKTGLGLSDGVLLTVGDGV
jgi:hypothetical protein